MAHGAADGPAVATLRDERFALAKAAKARDDHRRLGHQLDRALLIQLFKWLNERREGG